MRLTVATWNINSVRARLGLVLRYLEEARPDLLCLQETKCTDDQFPLAEIRKLGYPHIAHTGIKAYNGVAILSRLPFDRVESHPFCARADARHIAVRLAPEAGPAAGLNLHDLYVPAGGDAPDPDLNPKFAHKLQFLAELQTWSAERLALGEPSILVGDLNVAPLESDVWSHRQLLDVVSHTPVETEALLAAQAGGAWLDAVRTLNPEPERVFTWWSYRSPDWAASDRGRRLDHVWLSASLAPALCASSVHKAARGWERPSDHVPVTATLEL